MLQVLQVSTKRKGAAGMLVMFAMLLVLASILGIQTLPISQTFGEKTADSVEDLSRVVQTKSATFNYFYNYVPTAGTYSVHQTTFDLANKGGGESINWETDTEFDNLYVRDLSSCTSSGGGSNLFSGFLGALLSGSSFECLLNADYTGQVPSNSFDGFKQYYKNNYVENPTVLNCDFADVGSATFDITSAAPPITGIPVTVEADQALEATCQFVDGSVKYSSRGDSFQTFSTSEDNRYYILAEDTANVLKLLREDWATNVDEETGSARDGCYTYLPEPPWKEAEENAVSKMESTISSRLSNVIEDYRTKENGRLKGSEAIKEGFEIERRNLDVDPSGQFNYGTTSEIFQGANVEYDEETGCEGCECCDDDEEDCTKEYYAKAWVTVEAHESALDWVLKDEQYKIPTENGWRNLEFTVTKYNHSFEEDSSYEGEGTNIN